MLLESRAAAALFARLRPARRKVLPMTRLGFLALIAALIAELGSFIEARAAEPKASAPVAPLKVCVLSGCDTYHSTKSLPPSTDPPSS